MAFTAEQQAQLAQLQAARAGQAVTDVQAVTAWLQSATGAQAGLALINTALQDLDSTDTLYTQLSQLKQMLTLSGANLTTSLAPFQARAAAATGS